MLIPLDRKPEWHNPPVITLLLICLNALIFFGFQFNDQREENIALEYYFNSELTTLELPRYRPHRYQNTNSISKEDQISIFWAMQADGNFLKQLRNGTIIKPDEDIYLKWKTQREHFDQLMNDIFSYRYSLKTAEPTLLTLFSHMFLHADISHLIGNMLFLFLFGFVVEMTLGRNLYLGAYILSGLLSASFDIALNPGSGLWGLGASGAISGVAGMYTVLFGMRKIRFFYTLLFYFDYIKAPALIMLPVWLSYELYQQFMYPESNINNLAHIGGLLAGAGIAFIAKRYSHSVNIDYIDKEEQTNEFNQQYALALNKVASLDFIAAKKIFKELNESQPNNLDVQIQLFNISKNNPDAEDFHYYTQQILSLKNIQRLPEKQLFDIYHEYINKASQTQLKAEQLSRLAIRFAMGHHIEEAEKIILYMVKRKPDYRLNAEGLASLISQFKKLNNQQKLAHYFSILEKMYPQSKEFQHAKLFINA